MTCERCYRPLDQGEHGVFLCPLERRDRAPVVRPDDIPGGVLIHHGLCNPDGTPRRFDSRSAIAAECRARGFVPWTDVYTEDRTKDARIHNDWLQSGEAQKARRDRVEARQEKYLARDRAAAHQR
jgi:hypothetical protein